MSLPNDAERIVRVLASDGDWVRPLEAAHLLGVSLGNAIAALDTAVKRGALVRSRIEWAFVDEYGTLNGERTIATVYCAPN
jgi:hypothetical protein